MPAKNLLDEALEKFDKLVSQPENYLSVQENLTEPAKELTKSIYDFTKKEEERLKVCNALPELIINNFDEEQIWQEINLQHEDRWTHLLSKVSMFMSDKTNFEIPIKISSTEDDNNSDQSSDDSMDETKLDEEGSDLSEGESEIEENEQNTLREESQINKKYEKTIVDDKFFKLREMEEFLDAEDKAMMSKEKNKKRRKNIDESDDDDNEDEIDLFEGWDSDESSIEDPTDGRYMKHDDFFDKQSDSDGEERQNLSIQGLQIKKKNKSKSENILHNIGRGNDSNDKLKSNLKKGKENKNKSESDTEIDLRDKDSNKRKKVSFNIEQPLSNEDDSDSNTDEQKVDENSKSAILSEYELRQQRLNKKISHLESSLLKDKPWTMKGEVDANSRPQNSLLEEVLDFDVTMRPAPVITEETTLKLQDIIMQRIKDKAWDDVERKNKPAPAVHEFKKQIVLDQEKSKSSLAQIYEQEYIKQREALNPDADEKPEEEPEQHKEIRKLMSVLYTKLDALCNFHYTPKIAVPEVKIISNIPAITMEEVAPVAVSDAVLLAPEEVKGKPKGHIIGKSERTDTDKKRERRKKKTRQREKEKERQKRDKLIEKLRPGLGNKYSKEKAAKILDKVTKERNVDKMEITNDNKTLTSSTAFFTRLQDEVSSSIQSKLKNKKTKNNKAISAKRMKL